jgi:hypothetical protein
MDWPEQIRARFPDWGAAIALLDWPEVRDQLSIGQTVTGVVIARAPFGVWLDIGVNFPALLLVPEMQGAKLRRITFDDYPAVGARVEAQICALSDSAEIILTQQRPEDDPWRDPYEFAVGREFVCRVARIMDYGYLMELKPGVWALLPPEKTNKRLSVGDECCVRVEAVDPARRQVEVAHADFKEFVFNRDAERRNALLAPFRRTEEPFTMFDESADLFYFHRLPVEVVSQLLQEKYIDPDERINDSPSPAEYFDFMRRHPGVTAHGYATHISREDYRVSIEGIAHAAPVPDSLLQDAKLLCRGAGQFKVDEDGLSIWFD